MAAFRISILDKGVGSGPGAGVAQILASITFETSIWNPLLVFTQADNYNKLLKLAGLDPAIYDLYASNLADGYAAGLTQTVTVLVTLVQHGAIVDPAILAAVRHGNALPILSAFTGPEGPAGPSGSGFAISVPSSGWSWVNQGPASVSTNTTIDAGSIYLRSGISTPGDNLRLRTRSLSAGKTLVAAFRIFSVPGATQSPYGGLFWRESGGAGKLSLFAIIRSNNSPYVNGIALYKFNSPTAYSGTSYSPIFTDATYTDNFIWVKMEDDGANRIFSISVDGENWHIHHTVARTDFLTADEWGIFVNSNNADIGIQLLLWQES